MTAAGPSRTGRPGPVGARPKKLGYCQAVTISRDGSGEPSLPRCPSQRALEPSEPGGCTGRDGRPGLMRQRTALFLVFLEHDASWVACGTVLAVEA